MGIAERKEREKAQKKDAIIDAAEKVFFAKGYENATMDEIAEEAEYSKGTIYLYFKNKEELYIAISGRSADIFYDLLKEEIDKGKNGKEKLDGIKKAYLRVFLEHPNQMQAILHASRYPAITDKMLNDETTRMQVQEKQQKLQGLILSAITMAIEDKSAPELASIKKEDLMMTFLGGGILLEGMYKHMFDIRDFCEKYYNIKPEVLIKAAYSLLKF
ncbi:MAG: TetR/AcrR family transcriptional regulator [Spirochaetia bacterium]|nr:TetR/AcrR family transcriptional regulator [Spirochaetia bacterium]